MLRAREVYNDAQVALSALNETEDEAMRRVLWVSAISLLRAALHVLGKVDAARNAELAERMRREWEALRGARPGPEIFWEFIEDARNLTLKQYDLIADLDDAFITTEDGRHITTERGAKVTLESFFRIKEGAYKGRDAREILAEASEWVSNYIGKFE